MKRRLSILLICSLLFSTLPAWAVDNKPLQVKKQPELQQVKTKKPVKIKLKRSPDGKYTWDLAGDDADEIVRVDKRLKKLLSVD